MKAKLLIAVTISSIALAMPAFADDSAKNADKGDNQTLAQASVGGDNAMNQNDATIPGDAASTDVDKVNPANGDDQD